MGDFSFAGRPCQRCIKRSIGHLCHDEIKTPSNTNNNKTNGSSAPVTKKPSTFVDTSSSIPVVPQHLVGKIINSYTIHINLNS